MTSSPTVLELCLADYKEVKTTQQLADAYMKSLRLAQWLDSWVNERRKEGYMVCLTIKSIQDERVQVVQVSMYDKRMLTWLKLSFPD